MLNLLNIGRALGLGLGLGFLAVALILGGLITARAILQRKNHATTNADENSASEEPEEIKE